METIHVRISFPTHFYKTANYKVIITVTEKTASYNVVTETQQCGWTLKSACKVGN